MNKYVFILLTSILCFCSCSKDEEINIDDYVMPTETYVPFTDILVPLQLRSEIDIPEPVMSHFNGMKEPNLATLMFEGTKNEEIVYLIYNIYYCWPQRIFDANGERIYYKSWPDYAAEWNWTCIYADIPDKYKEDYLRYNK